MEETLDYAYSVQAKPNDRSLPSSTLSSCSSIIIRFYDIELTDRVLARGRRIRLVNNSILSLKDPGSLQMEEIDEIIRVLVGLGLPGPTWTQIMAKIFSTAAGIDQNGSDGRRGGNIAGSDDGGGSSGRARGGSGGGGGANSDRTCGNGSVGSTIVVWITAVRCREYMYGENYGISERWMAGNREEQRWVPAAPGATEALEKVVFGSDCCKGTMESKGCDRMMMDEECMVCMEGYEVGKEISRMPCLHVYHGECIGNWLEVNHTCPLCRFPLSIVQFN